MRKIDTYRTSASCPRASVWFVLKMKKYIVVPLLAVLLVFPLQAQNRQLFRVNEHNVRTSLEVQVRYLLPVFVNRVIDGDTIVVDIENPPEGLQNRERVRFLGIDAPEMASRSRPAEHFAHESTQRAREMLEHRTVYLAFDWDLRDRFGRLLAYIYLSDGFCFNAWQVQNGYAVALTRFRFQFLDEFVNHENTARANRAGLWSTM